MTTHHPAQRDSFDELPQPELHDGVEPGGPGDSNRRRFLGYVLAAPVLATAGQIAQVGTAPHAQAAPAKPPRAQAAKGRPIPSNPQIPEYYEFVDSYRDACRPTNALLKVEIGKNGRPSFALPRSDNGQGIITSFAMIIAEEMDIDPDDVDVTLAPARAELIFNQLTGGSSSTYSLMQPVRVAAALAKGQLLDAAAALLEEDRQTLTTTGLKVVDTAGKALGFGELSEMAASSVTKPVEVLLKPREQFKVLGKSRNKKDQRAIATGQKNFVGDMNIPDAMPVVIARAPELNGFPGAMPTNMAEVLSMPGVLDVKMIGTGAAVRAETFGQAFEAVNALQPTMKWNAGTVAGKSDADLIPELKRAQLPLVVPAVPGKTIEQDMVHYARNGSALEPNSAIVSFDSKKGTAEVWAPSKSPINHQKIVSQRLGIPQNNVTFNVIEGGGSFGRKLFSDHVLDAADAAKAFDKPVKLLFDRAADCRQGRVKPLCTTRIRATLTEDSVASFEMRYGGVNMEVDEGFVDTITSQAIKAPLGNLAVSEAFWELSVLTPYNFGVNTRLMNEVNYGFNAGSTRNVYGPDTCTARELMIDKIADKLGRDPYEFRAEFTKTERAKKVLDRVAKEAGWGKKMPPGTAQGIGLHEEYKAVTACIVEVDARPETVNRNVDNISNPQESSSGTKTGPRVTKCTFVVDPGLLVNPRGYAAQMEGGINDGIANAMTAGLHFQNGHFVEASWDNYFYTRQWNTPLEMNVIVLEDSESPEPAGAGEAGVAATMSATVNAFRRATGKDPEFTPVMHDEPLPFKEIPTTPSIPPSPDNALEGLR